jgi:hypothetical protein
MIILNTLVKHERPFLPHRPNVSRTEGPQRGLLVVASYCNGYYIKQCLVHICESRVYLGVNSLFTSLLNPDLSFCVLYPPYSRLVGRRNELYSRHRPNTWAEPSLRNNATGVMLTALETLVNQENASLHLPLLNLA